MIDEYKLEPSAAIPPFTVNVSLSPKAASSLKAVHGHMTATIYFDGDGTPLPGEPSKAHRAVYLGHSTIALDKDNSALVTGLFLPLARTYRLSGKDYWAGVSVSSSPVGPPQHMINCEFKEAKISLAMVNGFQIHCKIFGEP